MNNQSFIFNNYILSYFNKVTVQLQHTERIVELSLLKKVLELYGDNKNLIEIGCVSPYYFDIKHSVYDLQDPHPLNTKINAKNIKTNNKYVLSISTVEHFDISGYNIKQSEFFDPITWLEQAMKDADGYFITFPLGFNNRLDNHIFLNSIDNITFLCRLESSDIWIQKKLSDLSLANKTYDFTYTTCANSIAIIQNLL